MQKIIRRFIVALSALLLLVLPCVSAQTLQEHAPTELHIVYEYGGTPVSDAEVCIYRVGNLLPGGGTYLVSPYSGYPLDDSLLYSAPRQMASLLYNYILYNQASPDSVLTTDEDGRATGSFRNGLYLIVPRKHTGSEGIYRSGPTLISLPYRASAGDDWSYEVTYLPKCSFTPHDRIGTMNLYVTKKWENDTQIQRPKEITVCLYRDSTLAEEVTLNEENRWLYHWKDLSEYYDWRVVEKPVSGYTVTMQGNVGSVLLTNTSIEITPDETPEHSQPTDPTAPTTPSGGGGKLPQTGVLWWPVPVLLCLGFALIVLGTGIRRGADYEA